TNCAGHSDDGNPPGLNGDLITIGGVGDDTLNPPNPFGPGGNDDELYDISSFLNQGDLLVNLTTNNPSNNDSIFVAILQLTAEIVNVCPQPPCDQRVPAPSALVMLGSGLLSAAGAGWFLRRRR
ncbi:MAG TPA: PEP-CTERM sorting domain-containing protein, partial [Methylomirabilota bacterium]|nr:PEP-CTERM sorting domain-containing protein [Methylomirabilota bacterium]